MKFGVREICDVVLKAKATQKVGNKVFYKNEPVIYFDTLKTSSMEGAATTVYAQGGRGNSRLVAWEGERTVTFTMEDALISPAGFMILSGAGLIEGSEANPIPVHTIETTDNFSLKTGENGGTDWDNDMSKDITKVVIKLAQKPYKVEDKKENYCYVMAVKNGEVITEPYIPVKEAPSESGAPYTITLEINKPILTVGSANDMVDTGTGEVTHANDLNWFKSADAILVDYYVEKKSEAIQIDITPDKFGGNYYLEASTLFRNTDGVDMPAEFIIPNCKIQSNFTFTMASSGDPSTFTFTIDAFPDYTRFNKTKKVLAAIQVIDTSSADSMIQRTAPTWSADAVTVDAFRHQTWADQEPQE